VPPIPPTINTIIGTLVRFSRYSLKHGIDESPPLTRRIVIMPARQTLRMPAGSQVRHARLRACGYSRPTLPSCACWRGHIDKGLPECPWHEPYSKIFRLPQALTNLDFKLTPSANLNTSNCSRCEPMRLQGRAKNRRTECV